MKEKLWIVALLAGLAGPGCGGSQSNKSAVSSQTLPNGLRVVVVHFPGSTNASLFSFLPLGLASDASGQAQWSHLVEHLVIRSTIPATSPQANAETLPDHLRLDFYGNTANWKEGVSHHHRWLEGVPFTETSLQAEKPRVNQECDFTARNFATHKFAIAAWNQGFRHGQKHIALKGDVTNASLSGVQRLRDERLAVSNQVTLCIVGGGEPGAVFGEVEKQFGGLNLRPPPSLSASRTPGNLDLTWDMDARHLLLTWTIPDSRQEDHAALMVAAQWLNARLASDSELARQVGMVFAGADLATPEGNYFFVSASLRPGARFENVRAALLAKVGRLYSDSAELGQASLIGRQLAASLTNVPELRLLQAQAPAGMSLAMVEGNLGLQLGMHEHRYGSDKETLAKRLEEVSPAKMRAAARKHLSDEKAALCTIQPGALPTSK